MTSAEGALSALLDALETRKPLIWNGDVLVTFDEVPVDSRMWCSQATMVLDDEDYAALRTLAPRGPLPGASVVQKAVEEERAKLFDIPDRPPRCDCGFMKRFQEDPDAKHRHDCPFGIWSVAHDANIEAAIRKPDLYTAGPSVTVEEYGPVHTWRREPVRGWIARLRRRLALDVNDCTCTFELAGHSPDCPMYVRD